MASETLHLPFSGGLDELVAKEYLDASARQASILNGEFVKAGSISKRTGLEYLPTAPAPGGALGAPTAGIRAVGWSRSSLSLIGSGGFYQYSGSGLVGTGVVPNVGVVRRPVPVSGNFAPPVLCDLEYGGRLLRVVVSHPGDLYGSVYDVDSGNTVLAPTLVTTNGTVSTYVVSAFALHNEPGGPVAIIVFHNTSDGSIKYSKYDPAVNSFSVPWPIATDVNTVDAAPYEDDPNSGWLLLYDVNGTAGVFGDTLRLAYWTTAGLQAAVDQSVVSLGTLEYGAYVCGRYGESVWAVWKTHNAGVDEYYAQRRPADTLFATGTTPLNFQAIGGGGSVASRVITGVAHLGTDKIFVSFRLTQTGDGANWGSFLSGWRVLSHFAGTVSSLAFGQIPHGLIAAAKPFVSSGEVYQAFVYNLNHQFVTTVVDAYKCKQPTLYLCRFEGVSDSMSTLGTIKPNRCFPVATAAPRQVFVAYVLSETDGAYHIGFSSSVDRDTTKAAVGINTISPGGGPQGAGATWAVDFLFGEAEERKLYQTSDLGSELSISAGVPFVSDGQTTFEDGFFNYPEFTTAALTGAATVLPSGDYTFAVVYKATDAAGLIHRSAPFILDPITVTFGAPGPVLSVMTPLGSYRDFFAAEDDLGKVYAEVYATGVNGATLFYYGEQPISNRSTIDPVPWPTSFDYPVTGLYEDGAPILYTTGGVLDHVNPPASSSQITHQKRKALVDETRQGVWLTKQFSQGLAPGFNEALYVSFPEGGDIMVLGSLDSRLIALARNSIWYIDGQGPSPNGLGASWTDPERIPSEVGCKSWQSIVAMPNGIMFQGSDNGIYLLGRDLTVSFIGRNVVDSTNAYPNIVSATLVPWSSHVRFVCLDTAGTGHLVIVYDHLLNAWTTHRYDHISDVPVAVCMSADATPRYTVLTSGGQVWQERLATDAALYLDEDDAYATHFVPTVVSLPFVKLQVQGYHRAKRVQFFGERLDDCGLQIQMAFNYDDTVRQTATWAASQLNSLAVKGQVEAYVGAAYNKQMSVQLTFSDTAGTAMTTGAGMRFASAAIELQNLGSRYKLLGAGARR